MQRRSRDGKIKIGASKERPAKLEPLRDETSKSANNNDGNSKSQSAKHERSESKGPKIPRNVNFYRHLITDKHASENDIEWVLKLRSPPSMGSFKMEPTSLTPFSFGDRELECQKQKRTYSDIDPKNKTFQLQHLYDKRLGPTVSQGNVQFECGLRDYAASSDKLKALEKNWSNIPKKDRVTKNDSATLYPSFEETTKIKTWSTKNLSIHTHSAFDGYSSYPKYPVLVDKLPKNVQSVRHLLAAPGQLLSSANWQLSMREYGFKSKSKDANDGEGNALGELKNIKRNPKKI